MRQVPGASTKQMGVNDYGADLSNPSNRNYLNSVMSSYLKEVKPTAVTITIKGNAKTVETPPEQTSSQPESNTITLLEANKERLKKLNTDKKIQELTDLGIIVPKEGKTFLYPGKERIGFIVNIDGAEIPYYQSSNKTSGKTSW